MFTDSKRKTLKQETKLFTHDKKKLTPEPEPKLFTQTKIVVLLLARKSINCGGKNK